MKRVVNIFSIVFALLNLQAGYSQQVAPAPYSSTIKVNYVRTWEAVKPYSSDADVISSSRTLQEVRMATQYFDGLGRPLQTVIKKGSMITGSSATDLVSPVVYDEFGREQVKYLPFAANSTGGNTSISDGVFKLNPFQQDSAFNKGMFSDESYFYSKTIFEPSPLNRPLESYAPGNNWVGTASQGTEANRRGIKMKYYINTTTDSVRVWNVTDVSNSFGTYASSGSYAAGLLFKNVTQDEHNKQVVEYKDKEGKVILKKVQLTATEDDGTGKGYYGWLCTYYIYDDLNNLRCVIQPEGVKALVTGSWSLTSTLLEEQCFRYEYDQLNRMIMKKVPGAGTVYMVYDARDRLVMTQDSMMRQRVEWMYTKYDALNRPIETGLWKIGNSRTYHAERADTSIAYPNLSGQTIEELTRTFYDNYDWRSAEGNPLSATRNSSYDSYLLTPSDGTWPYPQSATSQTSQLTGMVTGTRTKVLGTVSTYLYTVNFYDSKGRLIQVQSTNITGGTDIMINQYSWSGQPLLSIMKHEKAGTNAQETIVLTKLTYDDLSRLIKTEKKISTTKVSSGVMPSAWTVINEQEYDALGQLKKKKLGDTPLETLNYDYNIRGWMLGANRVYAKDTTSTSNWFGFDLGYDKTSFTVNGTGHNFSTAQYNGNINGMLWRSTGDDMLRKYDFTYDAANRFLSADFNQLNSNSFSKAAGTDFSVNTMSYDGNGNILSMKQRGLKGFGSVTIDSLIYSYVTGSNRLKQVLDGVNDSSSVLGDFKYYAQAKTATDYTYDGNGNMITDKNKSILDIEYNHLNLPGEILVGLNPTQAYGGGTINYTYDATGNKLKKEISENPSHSIFITKTTSYINGFVYESMTKTPTGSYPFENYTDRLQFIGTEEGRARINKDSSAVVYDYMIKDHLGNVRMMLTSEKDTSFYPVASLESADIANERIYYSRLDTGRVEISTINEYPADGYTDPNEYTQDLDPQDKIKIGSGIVLRVMAGDKFSFRVHSWHNNENYPFNAPENALTDLIGALSNGIGGITSNHNGPTVSELANSSVLSNSITNFLNSQGGYDTEKPKAFVNWVLFDNQFRFVAGSSGFEQVGEKQVLTAHTRDNMLVSKTGFLYIYVSNETESSVFFDNLQVTHIRGPLLEENHYYPFGLQQAGISNKALSFGEPKNKEKTFQGQRFDDELGLNWVQFKWRNHDPQVGRFIEIDPLSEKYEYNSTYAFSENKVTIFIELEGLEGSWAGMGKDWTSEQWDGFNKGLTKTYEKAAIVTGAVVGVGLSLAFPTVAGPIIASYVFGVPSPGAPTSMVSTVSTETAAVVNTARTEATVVSQEVSLATRAKEIHSALKPGTQGRTTTAVASATSSEGNTVTLVASSEKNLRPAQRAALQPGEVAVSGKGHAEQTIINHANANGMTVNAVAASRPVCAGCATAISNAGAVPASPLKIIKPAVAASTYVKPPVTLLPLRN